MREGGKKHLGKKNIEPIFGKVNGGDEIKKHWTYLWKSWWGRRNKKSFWPILKKVYEGDENKTSKKKT